MKEQKLKDILALFDNGDFILFKWKNELNWPVEFVSSNVKKIFGYSVEEFENGDVRYADIIHKDDLDRVTKEVVEGSKSKLNEFIHEPYRVKKRDGNYIWLYDSTKILRDENDNITHYIGYIVDVSYHKELEQKLHDLNENLQHEIDRQVKEIRAKDELLIQQSKIIAMSEMITNIAHQWRQPLNTIGLILQKFELAYIRDSISKEFINKNVSKGMRLIDKMSKTIDDLRTFFKPKEEKTKFNILEAIKESISLVEDFYNYHQIDINSNLDLSENIQIYGYKSEFLQVVLNILTNAKDVLIERKVKNPTIIINLSIRENILNIAIKDNGGGIDKKIVDRIFEPYFTTKEQGKGIGVGLYMSKMIIENSMNGKLYVENENEGAIFIIELSI